MRQKVEFFHQNDGEDVYIRQTVIPGVGGGMADEERKMAQESGRKWQSHAGLWKRRGVSGSIVWLFVGEGRGLVCQYLVQKEIRREGETSRECLHNVGW